MSRRNWIGLGVALVGLLVYLAGMRLRGESFPFDVDEPADEPVPLEADE